MGVYENKRRRQEPGKGATAFFLSLLPFSILNCIFAGTHCSKLNRRGMVTEQHVVTFLGCIATYHLFAFANRPNLNEKDMVRTHNKL